MENIGLQLWSVREEMENDLLGMIKRLSEMGYKGAQFAGFFQNEAEHVKKQMDEFNLKPAGAHVQIEQLTDQLDETLKYHDTIGNNLIIVPWLPEDMRTTAEDYKHTAELLNKIGEKLHVRGFTLGYHNHDFEFQTFDDKTGLEILFENSDPNYLKMELDCYWAAFTNNDPVGLIEQYADRCISLHIKDMKVEGYQAISTELGSGTLPLADYMRKGKEIGVEWLIVEQEHFSKDPLESAKENIEAIRKLL